MFLIHCSRESIVERIVESFLIFLVYSCNVKKKKKKKETANHVSTVHNVNKYVHYLNVYAGCQEMK